MYKYKILYFNWNINFRYNTVTHPCTDTPSGPVWPSPCMSRCSCSGTRHACHRSMPWWRPPRWNMSSTLCFLSRHVVLHNADIQSAIPVVRPIHSTLYIITVFRPAKSTLHIIPVLKPTQSILHVRPVFRPDKVTLHIIPYNPFNATPCWCTREAFSHAATTVWL